MDEREIKESLAAIDKEGRRVTASREASEQFLKEIGVLNRDGTMNPLFVDNVRIHRPTQPDSRISRL